MYHGENSATDWHRLAAAEVEAFQLPAGWQEGRISVSGYAIDSPHTQVVDDTVSLASNTKQGDMLYANLADAGTFLPHYPALSKLAIDSLHPANAPSGRPMLHKRIGRDILSLKQDRPRPGLFVATGISADGSTRAYVPSHSIVHSTQIGYAEVDRAIAANKTPQDIALSALHNAGLRLFRARHANGAIDQAPASPSRLLVQEAMIATRGTMAEFAYNNGVGIIYRTHSRKRRPYRMPAGYEHIGRDAISTINPGPHEALGKELYAAGGSPLREPLDYINTANIAAFLLDRRPPFGREALRTAADLDNRRAAAISRNQRPYNGQRQHQSRY